MSVGFIDIVIHFDHIATGAARDAVPNCIAKGAVDPINSDGRYWITTVGTVGLPEAHEFVHGQIERQISMFSRALIGVKFTFGRLMVGSSS